MERENSRSRLVANECVKFKCTKTEKASTFESFNQNDDTNSCHRLHSNWTSSPIRHASESEGSDDTHISATPKKRTKIAADEDDQVTSCLRDYNKSLRKPLQERSVNIVINAEKQRPRIINNLADILKAKDLDCQRPAVQRLTGVKCKPVKEQKIVHAADSKRVNTEGSAYSLSPAGLPAGFNIKIRRVGERRMKVECTNADTLPAGFFASCATSSFFRSGSKSTHTNMDIDLTEATKILDKSDACHTDDTKKLDDQGGFDTEFLPGSKVSYNDDYSTDVGIANVNVFEKNFKDKEINGEILNPEENTGPRDYFEKLTVTVLKKMLARRGLRTSGSKQILVARLAELDGGGSISCKFEENSENKKLEISNGSGISTRGSKKRGMCPRTSNTHNIDYLPQEEMALPANEKHYKAELVHQTTSDVKGETLNTAIATRLTRRVKRILVEKEAPGVVHLTSKSKSDCEEPHKVPGRNSRSAKGTNTLNKEGIPVKMSGIRKGSLPAASGETKAEEIENGGQIRKVPSKGHLSMNLLPTSQSTKRFTQSKKNATGNFVKLNINGKSGRNHKFLNRTRTRKPAIYGRRRYYRKSWKKDETCFDDSDAILNVATDVDYSGETKLKKRETKRKSTFPLKSREVIEPLSSSKDDTLYTHNLTTPSCSGSERIKGAIPIATSSCRKGNKVEEETLAKAKVKARETPSEENLQRILQLIFGFDSFRSGQCHVIQRVLARQSTLVVLPTGAGKSLCYQLPAYLLPGITLVISPLLSLMVDQLRHLPPRLPGAIISSAQTSKESNAVLKLLHSGDVKILFVSPERLFCEGFLSSVADLPEISLVVVDEAHCLSEWSHNFRSSYYRLGSVLQQRLRANCILAMTATATSRTEKSILTSLSINPKNVLRDCAVRKNVFLSVSHSEKNKLKDLLNLLQKHPFSEAKSMIIYCKFQAEADIICSHLQQKSILAESYHGSKTTQNRKRIQDLFCCNKLRIVVATVAFGMGLDKSDVQAVIHYSLPSSLEQYVQETGRSGRDGSPSYCHLFVDNVSYLKLRSLAYSDGVDENAVQEFLCRVFEGGSSHAKPGDVKSLRIAALTRDLDVKEEVMVTILSYLEVGNVPYLRVLPQFKTTCCLSFYKSSPSSLAQRNVLVAAILKRSQLKQAQFVFDICSLANDLNVQYMDVQQELQSLQVDGEIAFELQDPAFCFSVLEVPEDKCSLAHTVTSQLNQAEKSKVQKLDAMYMVASTAAMMFNELNNVRDSEAVVRQEVLLQRNIKNYFEMSEVSLACSSLPSFLKSSSLFLRADIKVFLRSHPDENFSGRAIARIFHGLGSPAYPSANWSRNHFWGRYVDTDFHAIMEAATSELLGVRKA
ncbi:hypothetical protein O6H91_03G081900 [Diphasiastrum complanatum]|nr:hypothetical protein O6H91_03G081900 [Diphasiastrum complanatum]